MKALGLIVWKSKTLWERKKVTKVTKSYPREESTTLRCIVANDLQMKVSTKGPLQASNANSESFPPWLPDFRPKRSTPKENHLLVPFSFPILSLILFFFVLSKNALKALMKKNMKRNQTHRRKDKDGLKWHFSFKYSWILENTPSSHYPHLI